MKFISQTLLTCMLCLMSLASNADIATSCFYYHNLGQNYHQLQCRTNSIASYVKCYSTDTKLATILKKSTSCLFKAELFKGGCVGCDLVCGKTTLTTCNKI